MKEISIYDCSIIELPRLKNRAGNITVVNNNDNIPFEIKRVFYIYDIPGGEDRGAHAHKECHQFLIAVSGSFEIEMDDGINKGQLHLIVHIMDFIYLPEYGQPKRDFLPARYA